MAHPALLPALIQQYETLRVLHADAAASPEVRQRMDDIAYQLCIVTGTNSVAAALVAARHHLPGARTTDDSLLSTPARLP